MDVAIFFKQLKQIVIMAIPGVFVASFSPKTNEHLVAALDRKIGAGAGADGGTDGGGGGVAAIEGGG